MLHFTRDIAKVLSSGMLASVGDWLSPHVKSQILQIPKTGSFKEVKHRKRMLFAVPITGQEPRTFCQVTDLAGNMM